MNGREVIGATDDVVAVEQDLGGDVVFVTFNELGYIQTGDRFWGDDFFLKLGISSIGFATPRPNWYPQEAMDALIPKVLKKIGARKVVTYGHSQGGYGALKFANRLNASIALAFCPQFSINPDDVGSFDQRFARYFDVSKSNGFRIEEADICEKSFVFFDKQEKLDFQNVMKISHFNGVHCVMAPFTMHNTIRLFTESRMSSNLIQACAAIDRMPTSMELRQLIRSGRSASKTYFDHMREQLVRRAHRSSIFIKRVNVRWPDSLTPVYEAMIAYLGGDKLQANKLIDEIKDLPGSFDLWQKFSKINFLYAECKVAERMCVAVPDNVFVCLHAVMTFVRASKYDLAARELERLSKYKQAIDHIAHFFEYASKVNRPDIVESLLSQPLEQSKRTGLEFRLVDFYLNRRDRQKAFGKLLKLMSECKESYQDLDRIGTCFTRMGENSFAFEIRQKLTRAEPGNIPFKLNFIESQIRPSPDLALKELNKLADNSAMQASNWEQASTLYARLQKPKDALKAINKAIEMQKSDLNLRYRLCWLLLAQKQFRQLQSELRLLLDNPKCHQGVQRQLGIIAEKSGDLELAIMFGEAQFRTNPLDPEACLYLARLLRLHNGRERSLKILVQLLHAEFQLPTLSEDQLLRLASELLELERAPLARKAAMETLSRYPDNIGAMKIKNSCDLYEKYGFSNEVENIGKPVKKNSLPFSMNKFWRKSARI